MPRDVHRVRSGEVVGGPQTTQLIEKFRPPGRLQCETWLLQRARSCILDFSSWKRLAGLSAPATISRPRE